MPTNLAELIAFFIAMNAEIEEGISLRASNREYFEDQLNSLISDYNLSRELADEFLVWLATQI